MEIKPEGTERVISKDISLTKKELKAARQKWIGVFVILAFLTYFIPYTFLTNVTKVYGAFLFWWIYIIAVIFCIYVISKQWRD